MDTRKEDIAIIGISLHLPYADSLEEYWDILKNQIECIGEFPKSRRDQIDAFLQKKYKKIYIDGNIPYAQGAYLDEIDKFPCKLFRFSPGEARLMDPCQRIFLQTAYEALEDAGYIGGRLKQRDIGVYIGYGSKFSRDYYSLISAFESESKAVAYIGNLPPVIPSRISYYLDLKGPSVLIDTACSSSLVALHTAISAIRNKDCSSAIVGGITLNLFPLKKSNNEKIGVDSSDGKARTFDNQATGTGWGEGSIAIVIKPVQKAIEDHDHIYSVIKGSAVNQDGYSMGITIPNIESQAALVKKAWEDARVSPDSISYIEAHGTGTMIGDPVELEALMRAFQEHTDQKQFCGIGSVKTNIGHLISASGLAGVVKCVLALNHKQIPPSLNFKVPNYKIPFEKSAVYVVDRPKEWEQTGTPRRCGVSSFGFSGTNAHVILEDYKKNVTGSRAEEYWPVLLSASTEELLYVLMQQYYTALETESVGEISSLSYTTLCARKHEQYRLIILAQSINDLRSKLQTILATRSYDQKHISCSSITISEEEKINLAAKQDLVNQQIIAYTKGKNLEELYQLCRAFCAGQPVDWFKIFKHISCQVLHLPLTPHEMARCWVKVPKPNVVQKNQNSFYHQKTWTKCEQPSRVFLEEQPVNTIVFLPQGVSAPTYLIDNADSGFYYVQYGDKYQEISHHCFTVCNRLEDYCMLFQKIGIEKVGRLLFLIGVEPVHASNLDELKQIQQMGIKALWTIVKAISKTEMGRSISIQVYTKYADAVTDNDAEIHFEYAALAGISKVISKEYPKILCKTIDVDDTFSAKEFLFELDALDPGAYAYRDHVRYQEKMNVCDPSQAPLSNVSIKNGGVYFITGGLSGIGLEIARHLAKKANVMLALVSRRAVPPREMWSDVLARKDDPRACKLIATVLQIEKLGSKVHLYDADISLEPSVQNLVQAIKAQYGKIDGIFHCAGVNRFEMLSDIENELFDEILSPKVYGTWLLYQYAREIEFMVLCSSISTVFPAVGQGAYVAANTFLDVFAKQTTTCKLLSIHWAAWLETGMAVDKGINHDTMVKAIHTADALKCMDFILQRKLTNVIVGQMNYQNAMWGETKNIPIALSETIQKNISMYKNRKEELTTETESKTKNSGTGTGSLENQIAEIWEGVLGYQDIDKDANFFDIGGNSILLTKIRDEIQTLMHQKISVGVFFSNPSIHKLCAYLLHKDDNNQVSAFLPEKKDIEKEKIDELIQSLRTGEKDMQSILDEIS